MENDFLFEKALLIEDDSSHAFLISRALTPLCKEIILAQSLSEGKDLASNDTFNLIVTDLNLPDSSRALSVKSIREISPNIPIIALTSSTLVQDAVEAMKNGASDFIVKEFGPDFVDILGLALSRVASSEILKRDREKLRAQMASLRTAIENGSEGMAVISSSGLLEYTNKAFADFASACGGSLDSLQSIIGPNVQQPNNIGQIIQEKIKELPVGSVWVSEVIVKSDNGPKTYELNISLVDGPQSKETVIWVKDISSLKRREKFQRDMLATTTHDLKNPLSAISVSADILAPMLADSSKPKEMVLRMASSAQSALNMIEEFLSARRIKEGSFILKPQPVSIVAAIEEELVNFKATLTAKQLSLELNSERAPSSWKLDSMGIKRVFTNLMSNAVKFSKKGGKIVVDIAEVARELHIRVQDEGCGMEPSEVQKIFERFSRLDRHAGVAGSGLGLFVVKSIVGAHGGRIDVISQLGKGTSFDVVLPAEPPVNERGELISLDFTA